MSLKNQLESVDLEKRNKELDIREAHISEQESILADAKTKIHVLEKTIQVKEGMVRQLTIKIEQLHTNEELTSEKYSAKSHKLSKDINNLQTELLKINDTMAETATKYESKQILLKKVSDELSGINNDIKERADYLKTQETMIEETISNWNSRLIAYKNDMQVVEQDKYKLLGDMVRLENSKIAIEEEVEVLESEKIKIAASNKEDVSANQEEMKLFDTLMSQKKTDLELMDASVVAKSKNISTREKSLKMREVALTKKENELEQKERRLKSNYGIAGLSYE